MNNERILSHKMSKKLDIDEINDVAGGSFRCYFTQGGTGNYIVGTDNCTDCEADW